MDMLSGAGHDAMNVARVAPTGMIFVPCKDGLSHNEAESATPPHLAAGAHTLLHTLLLQRELITLRWQGPTGSRATGSSLAGAPSGRSGLPDNQFDALVASGARDRMMSSASGR